MQTRPTPAATTGSPTPTSAIVVTRPLMTATEPAAPRAWTHNVHTSRAAIVLDGTLIASDRMPDGAHVGN
jgi:hypothetical protein